MGHLLLKLNYIPVFFKGLFSEKYSNHPRIATLNFIHIQKKVTYLKHLNNLKTKKYIEDFFTPLCIFIAQI